MRDKRTPKDVCGEANHRLDEFPRAMEYHKKHLNIAKEVGDRKEKGHAYLNIGDVHKSLGDVPRAATSNGVLQAILEQCRGNR